MSECASPSWSDFRIMTINMNGPGKADDRRKLVSNIMTTVSASVIFCQEIPGKFQEEVVAKCGPIGNYQLVQTEKEAAVLWRTEDFDGDPLHTTETWISAIKDSPQREWSDVDMSEVRSRVAMVKLQTQKRADLSFLAVSWHGPHRAVKKDKKIETFRGLICFLREVCKKTKVSSCIIGGDFNLDTSKDIGDVVSKEKLFVEVYELPARYQEAKKGKDILYKDNFVFFTDPVGYITVSSVRAFKSEDFSDSSDGDQEETYRPKASNNTEGKNLLDHDPIIGKLSFKPVEQTGKF